MQKDNSQKITAKYTKSYKILYDIFTKIFGVPLLSLDYISFKNFIQLNNKNQNIRDELHKYNVQKILPIMMKINAKLKYISSGSTGHFFKGIILKSDTSSFNDDNNIIAKFALKMTPYAKNPHYKSIFEISRPENTELKMLKVLSYFVLSGQTNHLILPVHSCYCSIYEFIKIMQYNKIIDGQKKYQKFIERYNNHEYEDTVSVMISELANQGDFLNFIREHYTTFKPIYWKIFFFQLLSVLAVIQYQFPAFRHNDLKANNLLIHDNGNEYQYSYNINGKKYITPPFKYILKLWDFDFACIPNIVDNIKIKEKFFNKMNITMRQNRYYDIHFFFCTLIDCGFFPPIMNSNIVGQETVDFIRRVIPNQYRVKPNNKNVNNKGRLLVNDEYLTPLQIIENDPYFDEFRIN